MQFHIHQILQEMYMKLLETVYENFQKGKISREELKKQTLEIVFTEKKYFRLYNVDKDFESEVLIMINSQLLKNLKNVQSSLFLFTFVKI